MNCPPERGRPRHIRDREGGGVADLHVPQVQARWDAEAVGVVEQEERLHDPRPRQRVPDERVQGRQGGHEQRVAGESEDQGVLGSRRRSHDSCAIALILSYMSVILNHVCN